MPPTKAESFSIANGEAIAVGVFVIALESVGKQVF
jgi:hypothetical protein